MNKEQKNNKSIESTTPALDFFSNDLTKDAIY